MEQVTGNRLQIRGDNRREAIGFCSSLFSAPALFPISYSLFPGLVFLSPVPYSLSPVTCSLLK
jgi:hypothetical protein